MQIYHQCLSVSPLLTQNHRVMESSGLEKAFKIILSNHQSDLLCLITIFLSITSTTLKCLQRWGLDHQLVPTLAHHYMKKFFLISNLNPGTTWDHYLTTFLCVSAVQFSGHRRFLKHPRFLLQKVQIRKVLSGCKEE